MNKKQYGWAICMACALQLFCVSGLATTGFSAYQPYLITMGGLTNTQASTVVLFRNLFGLFSMLAVTPLIRRFEVRRLVACAMVICASPFITYMVRQVSLESAFFSGTENGQLWEILQKKKYVENKQILLKFRGNAVICLITTDFWNQPGLRTTGCILSITTPQIENRKISKQIANNAVVSMDNIIGSSLILDNAKRKALMFASTDSNICQSSIGDRRYR